MKFADWLELKDELVVEGTLVTVVEVPLINEAFGQYKKFRISWVNPNGMPSVRYLLASNKREALEMAKEDIIRMIRDKRSSDPFARLPAGSKMTGHKGAARITDVQPVDNVEEIINMIKHLYKDRLPSIIAYAPGQPLPNIKMENIDAMDVKILLNALVSGAITNAYDYRLVKNVIDILKERYPNVITFKDKGVVNDKNWQLLRKFRQTVPPSTI